MDVKNNNKLLMAFCVYSWTNLIVKVITANNSKQQQKKLQEEWTLLYPLIFIYNVNTTTVLNQHSLIHSVSVYDNDDAAAADDDDDYIIQWLIFPNKYILIKYIYTSVLLLYYFVQIEFTASIFNNQLIDAKILHWFWKYGIRSRVCTRYLHMYINSVRWYIYLAFITCDFNQNAHKHTVNVNVRIEYGMP